MITKKVRSLHELVRRDGETLLKGDDVSLAVGNIVRVTVDYVDSSGDGVVELGNNYQLILGEIPREVIGNEITAIILPPGNGSIQAFCLTEDYIDRNHLWWGILVNRGMEVNDIVTVTIDRTTNSGRRIASHPDYPEGIQIFNCSTHPGHDVRVKVGESSPSRQSRYRAEYIESAEGTADQLVTNSRLYEKFEIDETAQKPIDVHLTDEATVADLVDPSTGTEHGNSPDVLFNLLERGDVFEATVTRVSNSGNGVIETIDNTEINIGPLLEQAVGTTTKCIYLGGIHAKCLADQSRGENYDKWIRKIPEHDIDPCDYTEAPEQESKKEPRASRQHQESERTKAEPSPITNEHDATMANTDANTNTQTIENDVTNSMERTEAKPQAVSEQDTEPDPKSANLEELREKAEADAVKEIPAKITTNSTTKQEYTRSPAIRKYVKARAGGACEACGDPAPFTTPTGDPYLHAHHIHELSDGGSDTIDTVAAVCPNCHYKIHHGADGNEYNQKLREKIIAIENTEHP